MKQHYPPIQVVNDKDEPIGAAAFDEIHKKGLLHRVVVIFVDDSDGRVLLQKRGPHVATNPLKWDVSAAGHVDEGEDYLTAAIRETSEELGLQNFELQDVDRLRLDTVVGQRLINRFIGVFRAVVPAGTPITIQESEVAAVQWLSVADAKRLVKQQPEDFVGDLAFFFNEYY